MSSLKIEIQKHEQIIVKVRGPYEIEFHFIDGKMERVVHNLPYHKTLNDWSFYAEAIGAMLRKAKTLKLDFGEDNNIPF